MRKSDATDAMARKSQEIGELQQALSTLKPYCQTNHPCAIPRPQPDASTMQGMQLDQPTLVVIIAVAAFLAGLCGERLRAELARQAWHKRRWKRGGHKRRWKRGEGGVASKTTRDPVADPAEQLRVVMGARFEKRRLLYVPKLRFCTPRKKQPELRTRSGV